MNSSNYNNWSFDWLFTQVNEVLSEFILEQLPANSKIKQRVSFFLNWLNSGNRISLTSDDFNFLQNILSEKSFKVKLFWRFPELKFFYYDFERDYLDKLKLAYSQASDSVMSGDIKNIIDSNTAKVDDVVKFREIEILRTLKSQFEKWESLDLDLLDEISKTFPENASHKNNKAYSLLQTSTSESVLKEAREILLKALDLSPKNIYVLNNLLYISDLKKFESAFHGEKFWNYSQKLSNLWLNYSPWKLDLPSDWFFSRDDDLNEKYSSYSFKDLKPYFDPTVFYNFSNVNFKSK